MAVKKPEGIASRSAVAPKGHVPPRADRSTGHPKPQPSDTHRARINSITSPSGSCMKTRSAVGSNPETRRTPAASHSRRAAARSSTMTSNEISAAEQ
jgi:hypothetical protein